MLSLFDLELYNFKNSKSDNALVVSKPIKEDLLTISFAQLTSDALAADGFCVTLIHPFKSWFTPSNGLSDIDYVRRYARIIIELEKEYDFSYSLH